LIRIGQPGAAQTGKLLVMTEPTHILSAERDDGDGLIVTFSDGTTAGYVVEELLELRPYRESVKESKGSSANSSYTVFGPWQVSP
jgi:hypothetical protein